MIKLKTIYELLNVSVERFSNNIAFTMLGGEDVTYREVKERVEQVQELLLDAGLNAGDKVALLSSSMPNWGVSYFAVTTAGMVVVPLMPDFTGEELDSLIEHSEAKALLVSDKLFTKLSKETVSKLNIVIRTKNLRRLQPRNVIRNSTIWTYNSTRTNTIDSTKSLSPVKPTQRQDKINRIIAEIVALDECRKRITTLLKYDLRSHNRVNSKTAATRRLSGNAKKVQNSFIAIK